MDDVNAALRRQVGRGRDATDPTKIPRAGWKDILYRVVMGIGESHVLLTAAGVTYYVLLALVPALTAFVAIYGLFTDPASAIDHVELLVGIVPQGALDIVRDQLLRLTTQPGGTLGLTLIVSLAIAFWSAGAGIRALFEAMNVAYDEREKRNFFLLNALSVLFSIGGTVSVVLVILTVVLMPAAIASVPIGIGLEWLVRIASYLVMLLVILVTLALLYRFGPSRRRARWRWITPGAGIAVLLLGIASVVFSWVVTNFMDYSATHGSLGAIIALMTWVWISVTIVIVGAQLNSEIEHQTARDSTTGPEKPLGMRGARMADRIGRVIPFDAEKVTLAPLTLEERKAQSLDPAIFAVPLVLLLFAINSKRRR